MDAYVADPQDALLSLMIVLAIDAAKCSKNAADNDEIPYAVYNRACPNGVALECYHGEHDPDSGTCDKEDDNIHSITCWRSIWPRQWQARSSATAKRPADW